MGMQHASCVQWGWLASVEIVLWDMFNVFYATCTHIDSPDQALNGLYFRHTSGTYLLVFLISTIDFTSLCLIQVSAITSLSAESRTNSSF